jgi:VCBS repeat protein/IPT/TIG domain-containing protein
MKPRFPRAGFLLLLAAVAAFAETRALPVAVRGGNVVSGRIEPVGDSDRFAIYLGVGDTLKATSREVPPYFGLFSNLVLLDPDGSDVTTLAKLVGQGKQRASLTFTAATEGLHVVGVSGDAGGFGGAAGTYEMKFAVRRAKVAPTTFDAAAGADLSVAFSAPAGSSVTIAAATRKGGFDLTEIRRPDATAEAGFSTAVVSKNRRTAKVKAFPLTGGDGIYELRGHYDAGSKVVVKLVVSTNEKRTLRRISDDEPRLDALITPFPARGIAGTTLHVAAANLDDLPILDGEGNVVGRRFPTFRLGSFTIPADTVVHPNGSIFQFPVPVGVQENESYDLSVVNADGQGSLTEDAFFVVPPPVATGMSVTTAGPAGGRHVRITGSSFRQGLSVRFDESVVQPDLIHATYLDLVAPSHAPGTVQVRVYDEFGQTSVVPGTFTYLDLPSNRITSATPSFLQALGGESVQVAGEDFGADTVLTLDGATMAAARISSSLLRFTSPQHEDATVDLRVTDQIEQTSVLRMRVKGFSDATDTAIPAPVTNTGSVDGWRAARVLAGDVDGDGDADLVLLRPELAFGGDANRSRIRLLVNGGSGTFTDATETKVPPVSGDEDWRARDGVLADLDGDGDLDLAIVTDDQVAGGARSSLRILRNNGSGTFADVTSASVPASTTYGDLNQGVAIAAANLDGANGTDLVLLHTGYFTETIVISGGPPPTPTDPAPPDIVTTYYYPGTRVLLNGGTGVFTRSASALPAITGSDATQYQGNALVLGDVDGDGDRDLLLTRATPITDPANAANHLRTASLLLNAGDATFTDASNARLPNASDPEYLQGARIQLADMDGDSDLDLLLVSDTRLVSPTTGQVSTSPALRIFANTGGTFSALSGVLPATEGVDSLQGDGIATGDLTGDGTREIVVVSSRAPNAEGHGARVAVKTGTRWNAGTLAFPDPLSSDDQRGSDVLLVDLDGDGDLDVVIGRDESGDAVRSTRILLNPRL